MHAGDLACPAGHVVGNETPELWGLPHLLLHQGGNVGVVDLLLLVGQDLEHLEDLPHLLRGQRVAQGLDAGGQRARPLCLPSTSSVVAKPTSSGRMIS